MKAKHSFVHRLLLAAWFLLVLACGFQSARAYYDPTAGHFLSADPLGHAASMDLHSFCNGDPINRFDPTGRFGKGALAGLGDGLDIGGQGPSLGTLTHADRTWSSSLGYGVGWVLGEIVKQVDLAALTAGAGRLVTAGFELGTEAVALRAGSLALSEGETGGMASWVQRSGSWAAQVVGKKTTFTATGQGELAFMKELAIAEVEGASVAMKEAQVTAQTTAFASSETACGASQASQLELNFSGAGNTSAAKTALVKFPNLYPDETSLPYPRRELSFDGTKWRALSENGTTVTPNGLYNFVVQNGNTYISRGNFGRGGHLDLSRGLDVDYAGQIRFGQGNNAGSLRFWDNASGHFQPPADFSRQAPLPPDLFKPFTP